MPGGTFIAAHPEVVRDLLTHPGLLAEEGPSEGAFITSIFHSRRLSGAAVPLTFIGLDGPEHGLQRSQFVAALLAVERNLGSAVQGEGEAPWTVETASVAALVETHVGSRMRSLLGVDAQLHAEFLAMLPLVEASFDATLRRGDLHNLIVRRRRFLKSAEALERSAEDDAAEGCAFGAALRVAGVNEPLARAALVELALATSISTTTGLILNLLALASQHHWSLSHLASDIDWRELSVGTSGPAAPVQMVRRRVGEPVAGLPAGATVLLHLGYAEHGRLTRSNSSGLRTTVIFGAGAHRCPGRSLAIQVAKGYLTALAAAAPHATVKIAGWRPNLVLARPTDLHLTRSGA